MLITSVLLLAYGQTGMFAQSIVVNQTNEYQLIDGFGGMNHTTWVEDLTEDHRAKAFSNDPGYMGLSILRVHIDPSVHRFPEQLPTALYATSQGAKVLASPWDPPSGLIDNSSGDPVLPYHNYGAYVRHLNSFNTLMNDSGVSLYAISIQNEPDIGEWTSWTQSEILTFAREFAGDIETLVLASESFNFKHNYTDPILNDSAASANVDIIGGHIYGNGLFDYPLAREKGKQVWMTEHLTGSDAPSLNDWNLAMSMGKEINDCMEANFSAYIWWYIRRFYSLIRDDGNISEKGYMLMHYSKFVRPGAIRVGVDVNSAQGVYATAFKTDSSMTIVVLNSNRDKRDITFDLTNTDYAEFEKFTSVKNKYMRNKGSFSTSQGSFTVPLEARSISTFTTSSGAGGRYGNIAPLPDAGENLYIQLPIGVSKAAITLDASNSYDPDGQIVNYSWAINGKQLTSTVTHDLTAPEGEHSFLLTVMDNDGVRSIDTVVVRIEKAIITDLWYEAECAGLGTTWESKVNTRASNNHYVRTPTGLELIEAPSDSVSDQIRINLSLPEEGDYKVWGRLVAKDAGANSFWVKMDDSDWILWEDIPPGSDWFWDDVHADNNENPVVFELSAGDHALYICYREDGILLDKILITNSGVNPTGIGGAAETCTPVGLEGENEISDLKLIPNPSDGKIQIGWDQAFTRLEVISLQGKVLLSRTYASPRNNEVLELQSGAGIYLLRVFNHKDYRISRLIII